MAIEYSIGMPSTDFEGCSAKVCRDFEAELGEIHGEDHHVHLLAGVPRRWRCRICSYRAEGSDRKDLTWRPAILKAWLWSPSYFALSCGGAPINILKDYIDQQKTPLGKRAYIPALNDGALRPDRVRRQSGSIGGIKIFCWLRHLSRQEHQTRGVKGLSQFTLAGSVQSVAPFP